MSQDFFFQKILSNLDIEFIKKKKLILAYSGGSDSSFLLFFLEYLVGKFDIPKPILFHLNHKLRDNKKEVLEIKKIMLNTGFDFYLKEKNILLLSKKIKKSIEETGRIFRYRELEKLKKKYSGIILTAHHLDDFFETSFIHLIRGAGESAFKNLPIYENEILRPLMKIYKTEILDFLRKNKIPFFEDETNTSNVYLRNRIRNQILPFFKKENLDIKKLYENFHEEPIFETFESKTKTFLKINLENFNLKDLKKVLDIYLKNLNLHHLSKNLYFEIKTKLVKKELIYLENQECFFWKSVDSELFLIPKNSILFHDIKQTVNKIYWNEKEFHFEENEEIAFFEDGLKIRIRNQTKEVSEIFRQNKIPTPIRKFIPILKLNGKVKMILFELFDSKLKNIIGEV